MYNTTNDHVSKKPAFPGNKEVVSSIFSRKQISSNRSVATIRNPYNVYRVGGGKKLKISRSFYEVRKIFSTTESRSLFKIRIIDLLIIKSKPIIHRNIEVEFSTVPIGSGWALIVDISWIRPPGWKDPILILHDSHCSIEGSWLIRITSLLDSLLKCEKVSTLKSPITESPIAYKRWPSKFGSSWLGDQVMKRKFALLNCLSVSAFYNVYPRGQSLRSTKNHFVELGRNRNPEQSPPKDKSSSWRTAARTPPKTDHLCESVRIPIALIELKSGRCHICRMSLPLKDYWYWSSALQVRARAFFINDSYW